MPAINQNQQERSSSSQYAETEEQKAGWWALREFMRGMKPKLLEGGTFFVQGYIQEILLDNGGYFKGEVDDNKGGKKPWYYVKVVACIADPRVSETPLPLPPKNFGAAFFDGWTQKGRSNLRGGMYNVHLAVTHTEPPQPLIDGVGTWLTGDYEKKPILLEVKFVGIEGDDSKYKGRKADLNIFLEKVHRDPDNAPDGGHDPFAPKAAAAPQVIEAQYSYTPVEPKQLAPAAKPASGTDEWGDPVKPVEAVGTANASTETVPTQMADLKITERQVKFILSLAEQVGQDEDAVQEESLTRYGNELADITRKQSAEFIAYYQQQRQQAVAA